MSLVTRRRPFRIDKIDPSILVWSEMSGNLLRTSTFQPGEMGGVL